jgi:ABC-type sugar transport system ATPase subunit
MRPGRELAARSAGAEVTIGIRPEALVRADSGAANPLRFTVEHVEWLGHETLAHLRAAEEPGARRSGVADTPPIGTYPTAAADVGGDARESRGPAGRRDRGSSGDVASNADGPTSDTANAARVVARLPGMHQLAAGEPLTLTVDPAHVYVFDADGRA